MGETMKIQRCMYLYVIIGLIMTMLIIGVLSPVQSSDCFCSVDTDYTDVPVGQIFMWAQSPSLLPSGWFVCNTSNHIVNDSIPNLESQFLAGYDSGYWSDIEDPPVWTQDVWYDTIGFQYGFKKVTVSISQLPAHTHTWLLRTYNGLGGLNPERAIVPVAAGTTGTSSSTGGGSGHNNLPPYRVVYYVMYCGV